jgi:two-component system cell cycle sensor histidine kinase/response regulator CckA
VAILGLVAIRASAHHESDLDAAEGFIDALSEPAALVAADGRLLAANAPWREIMGEQRRLPKGVAGSGLFAALVRARKGEMAEGMLRADGADRVATVSRLAGGRLLVRLAPPAPPEAVPPKSRPRRWSRREAPPPGSLDAFSGASPFGAALLEGLDPFNSRILEANPALLAMDGPTAKAGVLFGELIEPVTRNEAETRLAGGKAGPFEVRLARDPTRIAHLYLYKAEGPLVVYLIDVSEQKQIELQLAQAQKMQAIGQLAGGVAHDFNNLLTAIQLRLDELLHRHPVGDPSYEGLNEIRQTGVRAADLVRKLLAFSRKQTVQREVLDLGELISEFEVLLRRLLREDVKLITDYGRDLPQVRADKSQLETAVMNLAVNARDAVRAAKGGGIVRIRTARLTQEEAIALGFPAPTATPPSSRSATTAPAFRPTSWARSSTRSSPPSRWARARAWAWPPSTASSSRATAGSTSTAVRARARRSASSCRSTWCRRRRPRPPPSPPRRSRCVRPATCRAPAASCSSRTRTPCAASPPACCAPVATRCWRPATARRPC